MNKALSNLVISVRETDWKDLAELFARYPYSDTIAGLMTAKAYSENSLNLDNPGLKTFIQSNNPGIQYANLIRHMEDLTEHDQTVATFSTFDSKKETTAEESMNQTSETTVAGQKFHAAASKRPGSLKKQAEKSLPDSPAYLCEYTKWLLRQDPEKPENIILETGENKPLSHTKTTDSNQLRDEIVSEPLAVLYVQQGLIKEAIEMYMKLSLKIPNKSTYFAEIIKKLKKSN